MKKLLILLALCLPTLLMAEPGIGLSHTLLQKKKKKSGAIDKSRILFGPGIGVGAAFRSFSINLSPSVAYCFTDNFHAGVTLGEDGATHQILEDLGLMKMLPGMTVINPCDYNQTKAATLAIAKHHGPVYLRFGRPKVPIFTELLYLYCAE